MNPRTNAAVTESAAAGAKNIGTSRPSRFPHWVMFTSGAKWVKSVAVRKLTVVWMFVSQVIAVNGTGPGNREAWNVRMRNVQTAIIAEERRNAIEYSRYPIASRGLTPSSR